ncbi:MAG: hypothetical protein IPM58_14115 [Nitrospira sp.]|nr:hypothetical protein [Nitrospira sp.]
MTTSRSAQLTTIIRRTDRLIERGTGISASFTRWRLAIFLISLVVTITLYKLDWYQSGNLSLGLFLALFITVAAYHNRVESGIHRLRHWRQIKLTHLARMVLDWSAIPPRPGEAPKAHPFAADLDLFGAHSLTISSTPRCRTMAEHGYRAGS